MNMKSFHNQLFDLNSGKTVNRWKPDEIFPSLTSEDTTSKVDEILQLFTPNEKIAPVLEETEVADLAVTEKQSSRVVQTWNLGSLDSISTFDQKPVETFKGIEGTPVKLVLDEKQRVFAEARNQAETMINNAQTEAQEILSDAKKEADRLRAEAYEMGRSQALAELQKATEAAANIVDQLGNWQTETIRENETLLLEMLNKISRVLFGNGYPVTGEILTRNLDKVMRMADSLGDVRIYMNPEDSRILDPEWKNFQESLSGKNIQIIPSEEILRGGCYVQGQMGVLDARIDTQLNSILTALEKDHESDKEKNA
jgi:flagellar biosynthesis/type III secretory pathway protein FliH